MTFQICFLEVSTKINKQGIRVGRFFFQKIKQKARYVYYIPEKIKMFKRWEKRYKVKRERKNIYELNKEDKKKQKKTKGQKQKWKGAKRKELNKTLKEKDK